MLHGVDISAYQSSIPAADFVILKATEGLSFNDSRFHGWWKTLADEKKPRGVYHFAHPSNSAVAEADHFLRIVADAGGFNKTEDLLVLDHETRGSSPAHDSEWAQTWCAHVRQKTGVLPVVYTYLSFAWEGRCEGLGEYPLWIADPSRPAGNPRVPSPWKSWLLHQHSENGGIDHDVYNGTKWAGHVASNGGTTYPLLRQGSTDDMVKVLQEKLNAHGAKPKLVGDGNFGLKTEAAVKVFQKANKLTVDGIVGPQTWGALNKK